MASQKLFGLPDTKIYEKGREMRREVVRKRGRREEEGKRKKWGGREKGEGREGGREGGREADQ